MDSIKQKNHFKTPATGPSQDLNEQEVPSSPQGNEPSSPDLADLGLPASPTGTCTVTDDTSEEKSQKLDNGNEKEFAEKSRINDHKTGKVASSLSQAEWDDLFTAVLSKSPVKYTEDSSKEADPVKADDFESLAVDAKQVVEGEGSGNWKAERGETGEHDGKDVPDKTPAASEHSTLKCHTPQKPSKPKSKKKKLHPKQLVYADIAAEGTDGTDSGKSKKTKKKKKQPKTTSGPDKSVYEFTDETRPSSSTIKSTIKPKKENKKKMSKRKLFLSREIEEKGTWVQCTAEKCGKWRYLSKVTDPATVPDRWTCSMNTDEEYNSCEKTEADWSKLEFVDTRYVEGSLVWAKMPGYPWWPGMVEEDPDDQAYYETDSKQKPIRYHVVFFGKTVSRAWIPERSVRPFTRQNDTDHLGSLIVDGKNYRKRVQSACTMARQAVVLSIKKRLQTFGFGQRFQGHWGRQEVSSDENDKEPLKKTTRKSSPEEEAQSASAADLSDSGSVEELMEQAEKVLGNAESFLTSLQREGGGDNDDKSDEEFEYSPGKVMKISHEPPVLKKEKDQPEEPTPVNKRKGKKSNDNQVPKKKKKTALPEEDGKKSKTPSKEKQVSQEPAEPKKSPAFKAKMKKSKPVAPEKKNNTSTNDKEVINTDIEMKPKNEDKQAAPAKKAKKPSFKPPRQKKMTTTAIPVSKDKTESKATEPPPKSEPPIPFDSEVFTMEMDSQEESCNKQPKTGNKLPTKTTKKSAKKANTDQKAHGEDSDDMPPCALEASNADDADGFLSASNSPSMDLPDPVTTDSVCPSSPGMDLTEEDVDPAVLDSCVPSSPAMDFEEHLEDSNVPGSPLMDFDDHDASCLPVQGAEDPFSDNSQLLDMEE